PPAPPVPPPSQLNQPSGERLKDTMHGAPGTPAVPGPSPAGAPPAGRSSAVLANFLVRAGRLKGQRLVVRTPVVNIGRADYNDLVLPDESVSTAHAKLQRREGVWVLVDLDSTNGTFVDSERIKGESPLAPGAIVRFGDVALAFEPTDDAAGTAKGGGTRTLEAMKPRARPKPKPRPPVAQQKKSKGCGGSAAAFLLGVAGLVYWAFI
ncbi:MAG: FHA domain-containing protein, partial [Gemmatimonadales bacterium]